MSASAYLPLDIAAFVLLFSLTWRKVLSPGWMRADSARHYAVAIPFAATFLVIFGYIIVSFVSGTYKTPADIPENLFAASVHPLFVGMATNVLFGRLVDFNRDRRAILPWADHVVFWGITFAVAAFTIVLVMNATDLFKFVTPILGISILTGIAAHTWRLQSRRETQPHQVTPAASDAG
jgi:hypothetical protein